MSWERLMSCRSPTFSIVTRPGVSLGSDGSTRPEVLTFTDATRNRGNGASAGRAGTLCGSTAAATGGDAAGSNPAAAAGASFVADTFSAGEAEGSAVTAAAASGPGSPADAGRPRAMATPRSGAIAVMRKAAATAAPAIQIDPARPRG